MTITLEHIFSLMCHKKWIEGSSIYQHNNPSS